VVYRFMLCGVCTELFCVSVKSRRTLLIQNYMYRLDTTVARDTTTSHVICHLTHCWTTRTLAILDVGCIKRNDQKVLNVGNYQY